MPKSAIADKPAKPATDPAIAALESWVNAEMARVDSLEHPTFGASMPPRGGDPAKRLDLLLTFLGSQYISFTSAADPIEGRAAALEAALKDHVNRIVNRVRTSLLVALREAGNLAEQVKPDFLLLPDSLPCGLLSSEFHGGGLCVVDTTRLPEGHELRLPKEQLLGGRYFVLGTTDGRQPRRFYSKEDAYDLTALLVAREQRKAEAERVHKERLAEERRIAHENHPAVRKAREEERLRELEVKVERLTANKEESPR